MRGLPSKSSSDVSHLTRCRLATCNLNQWANDYDGNLARIKQSIIEAKAQGAKYRLGPELEVSGYSMEDHFLEMDTYLHCDQSLAEILDSDLTDGILCDIGCPILHRNVRYNCRVFCLNRQIVLIRPKLYLADDGNYRERRYFTSWKYPSELQMHTVSDTLFSVTGVRMVPFGVAAIATKETLLSAEMCEELWTPKAPHIEMALAGVEIFTNGSGSHHQLRKLQYRLDLLASATNHCGGVYMYANQRGCDGNRLYFDGSSLIYVNGTLLAQASQFSLRDVEVISATVDLEDVRTYRQGASSFQEQSSEFADQKKLPVIHLEHFSLAVGSNLPAVSITRPIAPLLHTPEEECAYGPACWLWDYLRRSSAGGYLLPLSGGADSAATATIVYVMCEMAVREAKEGSPGVMEDIRRLMGQQSSSSTSSSPLSSDIIVTDVPSAKDLCNHILHTAYMSTENSSSLTSSRAKSLAESIGAYHISFNIDLVVNAVLQVFAIVTGGRKPQYESEGGTPAEDLALQNIQARLRMVMAYLFAQLCPWLRKKTSFLLGTGLSFYCSCYSLLVYHN